MSSTEKMSCVCSPLYCTMPARLSIRSSMKDLTSMSLAPSSGVQVVNREDSSPQLASSATWITTSRSQLLEEEELPKNSHHGFGSGDRLSKSNVAPRSSCVQRVHDHLANKVDRPGITFHLKIFKEVQLGPQWSRAGDRSRNKVGETKTHPG